MTTIASQTFAANEASPATTTLHPAYRRDIDGLRAVAILIVVGYHAFPYTVPYGFIGVDVFFVISGYLISTILFKNLANDSFSFTDFYSRRIRRIFPALFVVLASCLIAAWFTLLEDEYKALGKQVAGSTLFISNFIFWQESGYFDSDGGTKLLLHLWSLAIEEQFYVVWPVVLLLVWRTRTGALKAGAIIALASFVLNLVQSRFDPSGDFFSPLTRFWELLVGGGLAYAHLRTPRTQATSRSLGLASIAGIVVFGLAVFFARPNGFPGIYAVLPVAAAALTIAAGPQTWFNRVVLSNRAMVGIGLISYPLYLWHWPLLAFVRIINPEVAPRSTRVIAVVAAFCLAWGTYRWIEKPLRRVARQDLVAIGLCIAVLACGIAGIAVYTADGATLRAAATRPIVNQGDVGHDLFHRYSSINFKRCTPYSIYEKTGRWNGVIRCFQTGNGPLQVAIIGDSHAEHLFLGLAEARPTVNTVFYSRGSIPVVGNPEYAEIFESVMKDPGIRNVVLGAWWSFRLWELPVERRSAELERTVDELMKAGKSVYLIKDTPHFAFNPTFCKYAAGRLRPHRCTEPSAGLAADSETPDRLFEALNAKFPTLHVVDTAGYFCAQGTCTMENDGLLLFRDDNHLNVNGSRFLAQRLLLRHPGL